MLIKTPVSIGELLDKISILRIKTIKISDASKLNLINEELFVLEETLKKSTNNSKVKIY